ncbi:PREDICTED: uncharacterized protein LOC108556612 [Nicrophorus vespilloides]|uniref:Uncharacterized protein LOC108556612 n=1 Tax=Nicrophorus vespilloides TaxID=110193 RepID=A0ABM1M131_NICVS|nr:PREDICTED: uncharacterized protein LOC108556612 [Nicrophorus vespilloides]
MKFLLIVTLLTLFSVSQTHPTSYKLNEHQVLEADLVPVSSTVIPLPIYQVGFGLTFSGSEKKHSKPVGPIGLITSANKKKYYGKKASEDDVITIVKEVKDSD